MLRDGAAYPRRRPAEEPRTQAVTLRPLFPVSLACAAWLREARVKLGKSVHAVPARRSCPGFGEEHGGQASCRQFLKLTAG